MSNTVLTKFQKWLLGDSAPPEEETGHDPAPPPSVSRRRLLAPYLGPVEASLSKILIDQPAVAPGRIYLIDLEPLKVELGEQWPRLTEVIDSVSRTVFRRHLSGGEVHCKHGDDGFLVVFDGRSVAAATLTCQRIAGDLHAMLLGTAGSAEIQLRTVVGQRDSQLLLQQVSVADQAIRVSQPAAAPGAPAEPPFGAARTNLHEPSDGEPGWNQIHWHGEDEPPAEPAAMASRRAPAIVADEPGWEPLQIDRLNRPSPPAPPTAEELRALTDPTYLFQPVWDTKNKLLSTYLCLTPEEIAAEPTCVAAGVELAEEEANAIATFDLNKLLHAVDMLDELVRNKFQLFVSTAVHSETMASLRLRRQYLHVLRRIPEKLRKLLVLRLHGLPDGIATGHIVKCVTALRPNCGAIFVESAFDPAEVAKFAGIGVHAVGADVRMASHSEQRLFGDLAKFAAETDKHHLWTFLTGVTTSSQVIGATAAGIRYLSGPRVGPASEVPMHIRQFNLEDFYRRLVGDRR